MRFKNIHLIIHESKSKGLFWSYIKFQLYSKSNHRVVSRDIKELSNEYS